MTNMSSAIQHVVIFFKENHCFDNYFGTFPNANGATLPHSPNPPKTDPDHRHAAWLKRKTTAVKLQFLEQDIPAYFAYARQFTLCDNYYTDVAGPSTPNHLMLVAGDSPIINNPSGSLVYNIPSLPGQLTKAKLTWGNYGGYIFSMLQDSTAAPALTSQQFAVDAKAGKLPAVSWVYAPHDSSEHPPDPPDAGNPLVGNVTHGMQWTVDQVNAIVQGGLWPSTAIFITWDDWGGWLDHVDPPEVEKWAADGTQFRYGSRVGCLVLSPYAKPGYISKVLHSHVSLIRFCEDTFSLPPLNSRVSAADGMADCFNFNQPPLKPPVATGVVKSKHKEENLD
jgi:phospholipase C